MEDHSLWCDWPAKEKETDVRPDIRGECHSSFPSIIMKKRLRKVHGRLNASWKISSLAVNGHKILVTAYRLDPWMKREDSCI